MSNFKASKVVTSLPETLEADMIYLVRVGAGFTIYVTDNTGLIPHELNAPAGGTPEVYVSPFRPGATGPWVWLETDQSGNPVDLVFNDGS